MIDDQIYDEYLDNLIEGNKDRCIEIVKKLMEEGKEVKELYVDLIQPSMYDVGKLWETGEISVADEHLATSINDRILTIIYPQVFSEEKVGRSAIIACVTNEYHQLGGRMVADYFELMGWDSYFVGANTPLEDLLSLLDEKEPDILGLSLAMYSNLPELLDMIEAVRENYPDISILVGGQAFHVGGSDVLEDYEDVTYISSLDELEDMIT